MPAAHLRYSPGQPAERVDSQAEDDFPSGTPFVLGPPRRKSGRGASSLDAVEADERAQVMKPEDRPLSYDPALETAPLSDACADLLFEHLVAGARVAPAGREAFIAGARSLFAKDKRSALCLLSSAQGRTYQPGKVTTPTKVAVRSNRPGTAGVILRAVAVAPRRPKGLP